MSGVAKLSSAVSCDRAEKVGGGNGDVRLAGLELAERLPAKIGPGGGGMSSSCAATAGAVGAAGAWGRAGSTFSRNRFTVAAVQLFGDDMTCASPLVNGTGETANSVWGAVLADA
jgi:hypothetical protein